MDGLLALGFIIGGLWLVPIGLGYKLAKDKGKEPALGIILGAILGWLGVLILALMGSNAPTSSGPTKTCPQCAEKIQWAANVCKHCGTDVSGVSAPGACPDCGAPPAHPPTPRCRNCGRERVST